MYVAFFDESGYQPDWTTHIDQQPFYALGTVVLPGDGLSAAYDAIRGEVDAAGGGGAIGGPLGKGFEIKGSDIARGVGFWHDHTDERNAVREIYLSAPTRFGGTAIVVVIDKQAHLGKYATPANPYMLALKYAMERLEWFLRRDGQQAICIYDHNKRIDGAIGAEAAALRAEGSRITYESMFYRTEVVYDHELEHVLELAHGDSKNSIGLQVADFMATFAYQYYKGSCPADCGWWATLEAQLDRKNGNRYESFMGCGLKLVPSEAFRG